MRTGLARLTAAALAASTVLVGGPVAHLTRPATAEASSAFTDPHFRESPVFGPIDGPMAVRFASDGRAFVAEKNGSVVAFDSIADPTPTVTLDLRAETDDYWDRGLMNLVLDPGFLTGRPYLYVYYVYDAPPNQVAPVWNDGCAGDPVGPGATEDGCVVTAKLARYTVDTGTDVADPASRVELLHDFCAQFPSHSGGGMAFGTDGQLYLAGGDGASFTLRDYGQRGGTIPDAANPFTPVNPCGDPVTVTSAPGTTPVVDVATAEGGSLRSQDVRTTGDPTGLDGALVRIDPDSPTGEASAGNPLEASPGVDANARRIVAHGFRNPYRLTVQPGTGDLYIGDVGNSTWEEVERYVPGGGPATPTTLPNYGWPCYEGDAPTDGWPELGSNVCDALYAQGDAAVIDALYAYNHAGTAAPCGVDGLLTASVTGLAFYDAATADPGLAFPAKYDGALFLVDYSRKCMMALLAGPDGVPDPTTMEVVGTDLGNPVDLVGGPHGDLYYADLHGNRVMRVRYAAEPVAAATVTPDVSKAPVDVLLDASASLDPDPLGDLVSWQWDLDHDGTFDGPADRSGETVTWSIDTPAVYPISLRVTSSNGLSDTLELTVDASDAPPVPSIDLPAPGTTWEVGETITFAGSATDAEAPGGAVPASGLRWSLGILHCGPDDCHEHVVQTVDGAAGGTFTAPDHPYPSRIVLRLDATDDHGTVRRTSRELEPRTTTLAVTSVPAGIPITVGDETLPTPIAPITLIRGGAQPLSAPATWTSGAVTYRFGGWSDGSLARSRDITVGDPVALTATYVTDAPDTCAAAKPLKPGAWALERASGDGDEDWFSFTTTARGRVIASLGDLAVNARLQLYAGCGTLLATSDAAGTHFEELTRSLPAGTYRLRVGVPSGANAMEPYAVRALSAGTTLAVKSATVTRGSGTIRITGEVLNAGTRTVGPIKVVVRLVNASGKVVKTITTTAFGTRIGAGGVTPFRVSATVPSWTSVRYGLSAGSPHAARSLTLTSLIRTAGSGGTVNETGRIRNSGTTTAGPVAIARTWYGRRGEVLAARWANTTPSTLKRGASGRFTIVRPALTNIQATRTRLSGS